MTPSQSGSPVKSKPSPFLQRLSTSAPTLSNPARMPASLFSKPCVQAYEILCRGEFSPVHVFLHSCQLSVATKPPSDMFRCSYSSIGLCKPQCPACGDEEGCQICFFILRSEDSVVRASSVQDVLDGCCRLPFTSRPVWLALQSECPDLRCTRTHLVQGTRPFKRVTSIKDVKRYLNVASVASDGLFVVRRNEPLVPSRECIIVPRQALDGVLTALHLRLNHPSSYQLKTVVKRYLYALDMDKAVDRVSACLSSVRSFAPNTKCTHPAINLPTASRYWNIFCCRHC